MKTEIGIVGTGGVGRMVHQILIDLNKDTGESFDIRGYFDDDSTIHGTSIWGEDVLGGVNEVRSFDVDGVVVAIADPSIRSSIVDQLPDMLEFPSLIHPSAWIADHVEIDKGCVVYPNCSIDYNVTLGPHTQINTNSTVGHDSRIDAFCTMSPGVNVGGTNHVGTEVFFGINSATVQGVSIGDRATIGAGSTVIDDVFEGQTVVGTPASDIS